MKLYLSSMRLGDHVARLIDMAGPGARMGIITNALDAIPLQVQLEYARTKFDTIKYFSKNGFDPTLIDLRYYFGRKASLRDMLARYRIIWSVGGNAFLLRHAMRESGFDEIISDLISGEEVVYGGWSAGSCVAGSSLRGIELMDDPNIEAVDYCPASIVWEGLGLVPFTIIPHYQSDHPEARAASAAAQHLREQGAIFQTLRDGEVILRNGGDAVVLAKIP